MKERAISTLMQRKAPYMQNTPSLARPVSPLEDCRKVRRISGFRNQTNG